MANNAFANIPTNDVVDWCGRAPIYVKATTGSSNVKPGMMVTISGSTAHPTQGTFVAEMGFGFALYKETAPVYQKADYTSAYAKGVEIAIVPAGVPCYVLAFVGTTSYVGQNLHQAGSGSGALGVDLTTGIAAADTYYPRVRARAMVVADGPNARKPVWIGS